MRNMKTDREKLALWKNRLAAAERAYNSENELMDNRERLYLGKKTISPLVVDEKESVTPHLRNIWSELIEAQIDSNIPSPKVTALREGDEEKARIIEDMIRGELDRLPIEVINDMMERTVPIQGGACFFVEWDNTHRTHHTVGDLLLSATHPKQIIPQDGVYSDIEAMDYIILKNPQTKEGIRQRYGVIVEDESEEEPEIRTDSSTASDDLVTQYIAFYRNSKGGIGRYSWVCDIQLEDLEDYQARRIKRCRDCNSPEPQEEYNVLEGDSDSKAKTCPVCGGTVFVETLEEYEELYSPVTRSDGTQIGGMIVQKETLTEQNIFGIPKTIDVERPTLIPYYKPDIYPLILQKNVSVYGKFLGESDIDRIETHQNTINRLEKKIIDKIMTFGSYLVLPPEASIEVNSNDDKVIRLSNLQDKSLIDVITVEGNISQDMAYLSQAYEEARQIIGITDSFQGRADRTATSGKAKEFSAAQSAGRLESKRMMKDAAYARLFEAIFKFKLAYTDEVRPVISHNPLGDVKYSKFNRFDFLEQDETGEYWWNDLFLFSCDTSASLASNREAMWQETRMNLSTGAFGPSNDIETLILFWAKMEKLHYPDSKSTKAWLKERLEQEKMKAQSQASVLPQGNTEAAQTADLIHNLQEKGGGLYG